MQRREFITVPARTLGGWLLYSLAREPMLVAAEPGHVEVPMHFFTAEEAQVIRAACARIIPTDESGPGATEAGVFIFIDRQLAGPYGEDKYRYTKGPWADSVPEHGYQGKDNPREIYRAGIKRLGAQFPQLPPEQQDQILESIERTRFFELLRTHTLEGMFCDPVHGGNVGLVGWQLIGFPGPVMSYREQLEPYYGKAYRPKPRSLEQILGHAVHVSGESTE